MSDPVPTTYYFKAGSQTGEVFAGSLSATSEAEALRMLRRGGYVPVRIEPAPIREPFLRRQVLLGGGAKRLSIADCEALSRELSILLDAGIELVEALSVLIASLPRRSPRQRFLTAVRQWLRMGCTLSEAARRAGFDCPRDFVPVISAGEDTGSLPTAFSTLSRTYAETLRFSRLVVGALVYPAFLLVVAAAVLGIIAFVVAPSLSALFSSMDRPVPPVLGVLATLARTVVDQPMLALAAVAAPLAVLVAATSHPAGRELLRRGIFAVPLVGEAMTWAATRRFAVTLRLYLLSNIPLGSALPSSLFAAGFPSSAHDARRLADDIRRGRSLAAAVASHTQLPTKVAHLLRIGESSGRLPDALAAIGDEANLRFEKQMALVSALLAPLLIVVVGTFVGGIILSVFSALLDVNDLASY